MKKYSAVSALSNKSYLELLQFCACTSATASVIVQEPLGREPTLNQFLEHIVPVLISKDCYRVAWDAIDSGNGRDVQVFC
jgi:hypothetical protein